MTPRDPGASAPLRTAYLLNLTSLLPDAFATYPLPDSSLSSSFSYLSTFDAQWLAVLAGESWDPDSPPSAPDPEAKPTGVRGTDRVRLESVVRDLRDTLRAMLGLPLERNGRVKLDQDSANFLEPGAARSASRVREGEEGERETTMSCAVVGGEDASVGTPSLTFDDDDTTGEEDDERMLDVLGAAEISDDDDNDDDDDDDDDAFEEVEVVSRPAAAESFVIHFEATPTPLADLPTPQSQDQRRGFDPDAEYPEEEEGTVEQLDKELKAQVDAVFERTIARLEQLKLE